MLKINEKAQAITPAKKTIAVTDVLVEHLRLVDEDGDLTDLFIEALPEGTEKVSFKVTVELPTEE